MDRFLEIQFYYDMKSGDININETEMQIEK